jgi:hypothetical protein
MGTKIAAYVVPAGALTLTPAGALAVARHKLGACEEALLRSHEETRFAWAQSKAWIQRYGLQLRGDRQFTELQGLHE